MTLRLLVTGLAVGLIGASAAVAVDAEGKGKPPTTGAGCKPKVAVVLKGTLAATPAAAATAISVKVTSGNRWGRSYVAGPQPRSIGVNASTKVRGGGKKTLGALVSGDGVLVQARACKADLANNATPALTASKIVAHSPTAGDDDEDEDDDD